MPSFDCFISHNSKDKPAVRALKLALEVQGLRCWLDEEQLRPGLPWLNLLEQGIEGSGSVAVCVAADGIGPWEDEEMQAALRLAVRNGRPVILVLLPGAPAEPDLPLFLTNRGWVDLSTGLHSEGIARLVWGITGERRGSAVQDSSLDQVPQRDPGLAPSGPRPAQPGTTALYLLADAWGPRHGGINAFNTDFAKALGQLLWRTVQVACVVLDADAPAVADAAGSHVRLIPIGRSPDHEGFDHARAHDVAAALRAAGLPADGACWIGHDIVTGGVALAMRPVVVGARVVLVHHMSYIDYQGYKHGVGEIAKDKHNRQQGLFDAADLVFGVGPLLRDRLIDLVRRAPEEVGMIVPGLAEVEPRRMPTTFTACTFGRLDPQNDRIKQGRLAVAGFAELCRRAGWPGMPKVLARRPQLRLVGIGEPGGAEEQGLIAFAEDRAGSAVNLLPLPFDEDRRRLLDDLAGSSAALMLSWHEGFGLTGWEAIAAEVPLILGNDSGLHQLIAESLGGPGRGCVRALDIQGRTGAAGTGLDPATAGDNFTEADVAKVCDALLEVAADQEGAKLDAKRLRQQLDDQGFTWDQTARRFAEAVGLALGEPPVIAIAAAPPPVPPVVPTQPEPPAEAPLLDLPLRPVDADPTAGAVLAESRLLRADAECVPFHAAREPLLAELLDWATGDPAPHLAVQLRVGAGGIGKTRLLRELCHRLADQGWHAGFLRVATAFEPHRLTELMRAQPRVLIVIDYAETRQDTLIALLRAALRQPADRRLRIVLLARSAGDWWDRLPETHADLEDFLTGRSVRGPFAVPPIPADPGQRLALFREARAAFAAALHGAAAQPGVRPAPAALVPDLGAAHFGQILFIHLAALASLADQRPETATGLLDAQLRREARYWRQAIAAAGLPADLEPDLTQALALITLADGAPGSARCRALLDRLCSPQAGTPDRRDGLRRLLRGLYPRDGGIDALRPDLLGERLVDRELARDDALLDLTLGEGAEPALRRSALTVLTRLAQHSGDGEGWLRRGLGRHPGPCAEAALQVAIDTGDPAGRVLAEVLDGLADPKERLRLCDRLHPLLPERTIALLELAETAARHRLQAIEATAGARPKNAKNRLRLFDRLNAHAGRLRGLGRLEDARRGFERALGLARSLHSPGKPGSRSNLATALGNLATVVGDLGDPVTAERLDAEALGEVQAIRGRGLDPVALQRNLATGLGSHAIHLSALGRPQDALDEARRALDLHERLAESGRDASLADLATSLSNLATHLSNLGRFGEAFEHATRALEILEHLAETRPDAFVADLATSLSNLSKLLSDLGRNDEARGCVRRALEINRRLAEARPDAFAIDLARTSANSAWVALLNAQPADAPELAQEAVDLLQRRALTAPGAVGDALAWARSVLAWALLATGEAGPARAASAAACDDWADLLAARPAAEPHLTALTYWVAWRCEVAAGDPGQASARARESLTVLERWFGNGCEALPAYLHQPAVDMLQALGEPAPSGTQFPALSALLGRD